MSLYSDRARLQQVERWLRLNYPVKTRVVVRVEKIATEDLAICREGRDAVSFYIRIRKGSPIHEQIDCLLHEWAHLSKRRLNHGVLWGRRHQKIYRHWFDGGGSENSQGL